MTPARVRLPFVVVLVLVWAGALSTTVAAEETTQPYIVVLEDSVEDPQQVAEEQNVLAEGEPGIVYEHALKGYAAELSEETVEEIEEDPRVAFVEPDAPGEIAAQTTPTGVSRIFAPANAQLFIDETDTHRAFVDVAVMDTGIDHSHPDLDVEGRADCSGTTSCVSESGTDGHSHGTHVAGTIAALDNSFGVVGVAPGARLWAVKVVNNSGGGQLSQYINGLDWITARADKIEVVNSSLRYFVESSQAFNKAMSASINAGIVHVAAAGNESEKVRYLPGVYPDVITVSAIADYDGKPGAKASWTCKNHGADDSRAGFSNSGSIVDLAAPGACITSTVPGSSYAGNSGTSMASPHVAGAAALLAARNNPNSKADVDAIAKTLKEKGNLGWTDTSGDGVKEPLVDVSDPETFNVAGEAPQVVTGGVNDVQWNSAALHGTVDAETLPTTYYFEYGPTTSYGSKAPALTKSIGSGANAVAVEEAVSGLAAQTTYHYRLVASNTKGVVPGEHRTFTTPKRYIPRFDAESRPATVSGEQMSINPLKFKFGSNTVACSDVDTTAQLTRSSARLASSATHTGCTLGESSASINMKSCSYVFGVANSGPPYTGSLGISCANAGDAIEISVPSCLLKLFPQTVAGAVSYTLVGEGSEREVGVNISSKALNYKRTSGICVFLGPEASDGELAGTIKLSAANGSAEPVGVYLTGGGATGLALAGEGSPEPSKQPRFEANAYPAPVVGEQSALSPLTFNFKYNGSGTPISCGGAEFDSALSSAAAQFTALAKFTACTHGESSGSISMKSCSYVFGVANSGPPYTGSLGISCANAGDAIEISVPSCLLKLPPQTVPGAVSYANEGTGAERFVRATVSTKSLTFKRTAGICVFLGAEASNGELAGEVEAYGFG